MLAMFVHDRSITGMAESIRSGVDRYLEENLHEALLPKVQAELDLLGREKSGGPLPGDFGRIRNCCARWWIGLTALW